MTDNKYEHICNALDLLGPGMPTHNERWLYYAARSTPDSGTLLMRGEITPRFLLLVSHALYKAPCSFVIDIKRDDLNTLLNHINIHSQSTYEDVLFNRIKTVQEFAKNQRNTQWADVYLSNNVNESEQLHPDHTLWKNVKAGALAAFIRNKPGSDLHSSITDELNDISHFFFIQYGRKKFHLENYTGTVHVIIPVHNRIEQTLGALETLFAQSALNAIKVHVVDDGSTDNTSALIKSHYPQVNIMHGDGTLFWTGAAHFALETLKAQLQENDYFILMNNDVRLSPEAIEVLLQEASKNSKFCMIPAAVSDLKPAKPGWGIGIDSINEDFDAQYKLFARFNQHFPIATSYGRCTMFPAEILHMVGNYNAQDFPHYYGDIDFGHRVYDAGFYQTITAKTSMYVIEDDNTSGLQMQFFKEPQSLISIYKYLTDIRSRDCLKYLWKYCSIYNKPNRFRVIARTIWRALKQHYLLFHMTRMRGNT